MMTLIGQDFAQKMANDCYYVVSTTSITMDGPGAHWMKDQICSKILVIYQINFYIFSSTKQSK